MRTEETKNDEPCIVEVKLNGCYHVVYDPGHPMPLRVVPFNTEIPYLIAKYDGVTYICSDGMNWKTKEDGVLVPLYSELDMKLRDGMDDDYYGMVRNWRRAEVLRELRNTLRIRELNLYACSSNRDNDPDIDSVITYYVAIINCELDPYKNDLNYWEQVTDNRYHHNILSHYLLGMRECSDDRETDIKIDVPVYLNQPPSSVNKDEPFK